MGSGDDGGRRWSGRGCGGIVHENGWGRRNLITISSLAQIWDKEVFTMEIIGPMAPNFPSCPRVYDLEVLKPRWQRSKSPSAVRSPPSQTRTQQPSSTPPPSKNMSLFHPKDPLLQPLSSYSPRDEFPVAQHTSLRVQKVHKRPT